LRGQDASLRCRTVLRPFQNFKQHHFYSLANSIARLLLWSPVFRDVLLAGIPPLNLLATIKSKTSTTKVAAYTFRRRLRPSIAASAMTNHLHHGISQSATAKLRDGLETSSACALKRFVVAKDFGTIKSPILADFLR
jgi:hypothetical protein